MATITIRLADARTIALQYAQQIGTPLSESDLKEVSQQIFEALHNFTLEPHQPDKPTRYITGQSHIRVREILWEFILVSLSLFPSILVTNVATATVASAAFLRFLVGLGRKLTPLTDIQLEVCRAVVAVTSAKRKSGKLLTNNRATLNDVDTELRRRNIILPNLGLVLDDLVPHVLSRSFYLEQQQPDYELVV